MSGSGERLQLGTPGNPIPWRTQRRKEWASKQEAFNSPGFLFSIFFKIIIEIMGMSEHVLAPYVVVEAPVGMFMFGAVV